MHAETEQAYQLAGIDARVEPFIRDMAEAYAWADVVIGRAGALTVSELCAAGVASILIPLPTAVDDHQAMNAEFLKSHGGGWWFRQDERLEKNLEDALLDRLQQFLIELGHGFCFEARQKRVLIGGEHGFIDLVFYHRVLKCHVLVELKNDAFRHEHLGQLNAYVGYYQQHEMTNGGGRGP